MDEPTPEDPATKFSQKTIILRSCTPIKPSTCPTRALYQPDGDSDMWDNVDEERRKITRRNRHCSPLLRLAAEIRNAIYVLVLGNRTYHFHDAISRPYAKLKTNGERHILSLLLVCHQIYSEASLFPYSLNTFSFRETEISLTPFLLHRRLAHFRAIKSIELVTSQCARMWAAPENESMSTVLKDTRILERLPNLRYIRVLVDVNSGLYSDVSTRGLYSIAAVCDNQKKLEQKIMRRREDVVVTFSWI